MYYTIFRWNDGLEEDIESLIEISDPTAYREYGVQRRYTVHQGWQLRQNLKKPQTVHQQKISSPKTVENHPQRFC